MSEPIGGAWPDIYPPLAVVSAGRLRRLWVVVNLSLNGIEKRREWLVDPVEVVELVDATAKVLDFAKKPGDPDTFWPATLVRVRRQPDPVMVLGSLAQVCALLGLELEAMQ